LVGLAVAGGLAVTALGAAERPLVAAHRGGALLWPENSLTAFRGALGLGAHFVETDVHLSADGEVVILHDATLERTTTGAGTVRERTRGELRALRLKARTGAATDEPVPALADLLALLGPVPTRLLLEIKVGADGARYPGIEEKVLALVRGAGLAERTLVMAFQPETLRRVRELDATMRTVLLVGRPRTERERLRPAEFIARARAVGAGHLGLNHRLVDAEVVQAARAAGVTLAVWTVNEEADLRRVVDLGVDVVITDRPDLALRLVGR
jgi:glycerophosphoryl diester phosphodiesterase